MNNNMNTHLILLRHGKAEEREACSNDELRELTKRGIKEIEEMIPLLQKYINNESKVYIWCSYLLRSLQTAEIIAMGLKGAELQQFDWIAGGTLEDLQEELKKLESPSLVIVVGHEPDLSSWTREMTGYTLTYKKGMGIGIEIASLDSLQGKPLWMVLPDSIEIVRVNRQPLGEFKKILYSYLQEIFNMYQWFIKEPGEVESTHQLRVKIRSFRSLISFIKPLLNEKEYDSIQNQLRLFAQKFGYLREVDVLIEEWTKFLKTKPELAVTTPGFLDMLQTERSEEEQKLYDEMKDWKASQVLFDIYNWIRGLEDEIVTDYITEKVTFGEYIFKHLKRWEYALVSRFKKTNFSNLKEIHSLRIKYKKIRYVSNAMENYLPKKAGSKIDYYKSMQDHLGFICDSQRNVTVVSELNKKYPNTTMNYESGIFVGYKLGISDRLIKSLLKK